MINWIEKGTLAFVRRTFTARSGRFSEFDSRKVILFQVEVFGRNIKQTRFTQLRVIRRRNRSNIILLCNICYLNLLLLP